MYDYRLEGHLKQAVNTEDILVLNRILRSNILPKSRLQFYYHSAIQSGLLRAVKAFLASRAVHVDHVNNEHGNKGHITGLHEAILCNDVPMVKLLLCAGANVDAEASLCDTRANAPELAKALGASKMSSVIASYKQWICEKLHESIDYLTVTRDYVLFSGGRRVHSDLPETRLELVDEIIDYFGILRTHISVLQSQWKMLESIYDNKDILRLIDDNHKCIKILMDYHRFTKVEVKVYESRMMTSHKPFNL